MSGRFELHHGNSLDVLRTLADNSVDSIVTDPPYELGFMGRKWDSSGIANNVELWAECLRVLKPGGHLLAFSGSRTYHRMTCAIEDAGFEVRDQIMWLYGSGFPKSLDVSKAIDKAAGAEREITGVTYRPEGRAFAEGGSGFAKGETMLHDKPATAAAAWQGWGTALKPAHEPVCVARKPLIGTVAQNVLTHGTGATNIDGCRIGDGGGTRSIPNGDGNKSNDVFGVYAACDTKAIDGLGRWPANVIHDGSREVWSRFPIDGDASASRFFYGAKASREDRDEGLDCVVAGVVAGVGALRDGGRESLPRKNIHPTVKPTDLMRYLCRLVTPPDGIVLDIFMGSGSTGKAAILEGFRFIGIDLEADHVEIARARITHAEVMRGDIPKPANDNDEHPDLFAAAGVTA